jgi:hypothetical protein
VLSRSFFSHSFGVGLSFHITLFHTIHAFVLNPKLLVTVYYTGKHVSRVFEDLRKMKAPNITYETPPTLSLTHLLPLPFQIFGEKSLSEFESCGFCASSPNLSCSSSFELWYYIEFFVDSLLLELLAPRQLGVSCESPYLVEDHKKVCITRSFEQRLVCGLDLCGQQRED